MDVNQAYMGAEFLLPNKYIRHTNELTKTLSDYNNYTKWYQITKIQHANKTKVYEQQNYM